MEEVMSGRGQELPWETGHSQVHGPRETARGAGLGQKFWSLGVPWTRNCLGGGSEEKPSVFSPNPSQTPSLWLLFLPLPPPGDQNFTLGQRVEPVRVKS